MAQESAPAYGGLKIRSSPSDGLPGSHGEEIVVTVARAATVVKAGTECEEKIIRSTS